MDDNLSSTPSYLTTSPKMNAYSTTASALYPHHPPVTKLSNTDARPEATQSPIPTSSGQYSATPNASAAEKSVYDSLASQFNIIVLISTFSASLIIGFLSLANNVVKNSSLITFEIGMLLALISVGFHLITALVGGRAAMLCFRLSKNIESSFEKRTKASLTDFYRYLLLCEQLQLLGTGIFTPAALYMLYFMFNHHGFTWAIYGIAVVAGYLIYRLGFWKASVLWENLERCIKAMSCGFCGSGGNDLEKGNG